MSLILDGTNGSTMATWTLATRPSTPNVGQIGYNTSYGGLEIYNGTAWDIISGGPAFAAYANAGQGMSGTAAPISLQNKNFDTAGCFNNSGSTTTLNGLSVPAYSFMPFISGYYHFNFSVRASSASYEIVAYIQKNGTAVAQGTDVSPGWSSSGAAVMYLNGSTDYITLAAYTGGSVTVASRTSTVSGTTYGLDTFMQGLLLRGV